jgi:hypothetical protein
MKLLVPACRASISKLERQVDLLPVAGVVEASAPAAIRCSRPSAVDARRRHRHDGVLLRRSRGAERDRRRPEVPDAGVPAVRRSSSHSTGGDVRAALGEGALQLVRVLVAAQRLRAVELAVAVVAGERLPGGGGCGAGGTAAGGEVQAQVEADVAGRGVRGRLVLHRSERRRKGETLAS